MSLDVNKLRLAFTRLFSSPERVSTAQQAEEAWADAYHQYARDVTDISLDVPTNLSRDKFRRALNFRMSRTAEQFAKQIDKAFVDYWAGTVFATGLLPTGTTSCPNVGGTGVFAAESASAVLFVTPSAMFQALLPVVSTLKGSSVAAAAQFASAMDLVTKDAVTVLILGTDTTPPPTGPLPIQNVCGVF